jgi:hypothetical protein
MNDLLREGYVLVFAALDVDTVYHFDGGYSEICAYHAGENVLIVLGVDEFHDQATSRYKLARLVGGRSGRMDVGVKELPALSPPISVWKNRKAPIESHSVKYRISPVK